MISAVDITLEQARGRDAAGRLAPVEKGQPPAPIETDPTIETHPASLDVEYWKESDGTWGAHCSALGITVVADTETGIFPAMFEAIEEYWDILNERYETLSDDLRAQLGMRHLSLGFSKRA